MRETVFSLPTIARHFGDRDHTTILKGAQAFERRLKAATVATARDDDGKAGGEAGGKGNGCEAMSGGAS